MSDYRKMPIPYHKHLSTTIINIIQRQIYVCHIRNFVIQYICLQNLLYLIILKKSPYKGIAYITFNWCLSLTLCLDLLKEESVTLAWKKSHNHEPLSAYLPIFENGNTWDQKYWCLQEYSNSGFRDLWYLLVIRLIILSSALDSYLFS